MGKGKEAKEARNWCFDGSAGDAAGPESSGAWKSIELFRMAWGRPVAASPGPEYRGYRRIAQ